MVTKQPKDEVKFVGYKTVYTWPDGMEEKEGFFRYKGKLWSNGDVLYGGVTPASKARAMDGAAMMRKEGYITAVVLESEGSRIHCIAQKIEVKTLNTNNYYYYEGWHNGYKESRNAAF